MILTYQITYFEKNMTALLNPFINRQIIQFEFSPTWSCVSLTRSTSSSEWKLFRFN